MDACKCSFAWLFSILFITISWRCANALSSDDFEAFLGPDNCLISRLDVVPCVYARPETTSVPAANQYGIYMTRFRSGAGGFPTCEIRRKDHQVRNLTSIGTNNQVYVTFSPGFTLIPPERYGNEMFVDYNISCGEGRLAYFNITDMALEDPDCEDPSLHNALRCVDYVTVSRGAFGRTEDCGSNVRAVNMEQIETGNLRMFFRTSERRRRDGFRAQVVCFDPGQTDLSGCVTPELTPAGDIAYTTGNIGGRRRKRDLETINTQWMGSTDYSGGFSEGFFGSILPDTGPRIMDDIVLQYGQTMTFENGELIFRNARDALDSVIGIVDGIYNFFTFSADGVTSHYQVEARTPSGQLIEYRGPGTLTIISKAATLEMYGSVNPHRFAFTEAERVVFYDLSVAQLEVTVEDESQRLPLDFLEPSDEDDYYYYEDYYYEYYGGRRKRQAPTGQSPTTRVPPTETPLTETTSSPPTETTSSPPTETTSSPPTETTSSPPTETTSSPPIETTSSPPTETTSSPPTEPLPTTSAPPPSFSDQTIILALINENACNPVLRAAARATIEEVELTDPGRVALLRETYLG